MALFGCNYGYFFYNRNYIIVSLILEYHVVRKKKVPVWIKDVVFATIFLLLWIAIISIDRKTIVWDILFQTMSAWFGDYYRWIVSPVLIATSIFLFKERDLHFDMTRALGLLFYLFSVSTLIWLLTDYTAYFNLAPALLPYIWAGTTGLWFFVLFVSSLIILFRFSPIAFSQSVASGLKSWVSDMKESLVKQETPQTKSSATKSAKMDKRQMELDELKTQLQAEKKALALAKQKKAKLGTSKKVTIEKKTKLWSIFGKWDTDKDDAKLTRSNKFKDWEFPSLNLLDEFSTEIQYDASEIREKEIDIQETLLQFNIEVEMQWYKVGPTVIQYRLKPKSWVKLQKILNLKKDLTLALRAKNIRIQAPIPGLGVVGIEVPNDNRQIVGLKQVLASPQFNNKKLELPIALGKDVAWEVIVWDLAKMPHLLVAGQTASGKSVGMNGFLVSLLYKFSPSELKLIMIDPKRVELSVYNGIPHLLTPVITNPDKALNSLKWCVAEMLRRYDLATQVSARNFKEYNKKVKPAERLPYIVIVIDELADLMMSGNKKEVESSIARIAQMARAVGMHLIVATQRPSVDVITGLIKANIPSRIAFTVASQIDSQTILWNKGAEDLLGRWDMLYYPTGSMEASRVQWVLVETHEVESVVNKLKLTIDPDMLDNLQISEIANGKSKLAGSIMEWYDGDQSEDPEIIERAIAVVKESGKGSTSLIQRKLSLWYARAAKVLDILEDLWVVWPANGSKPREVYVD